VSPHHYFPELEAKTESGSFRVSNIPGLMRRLAVWREVSQSSVVVIRRFGEYTDTLMTLVEPALSLLETEFPAFIL